jgi:hypothetical protein
MDENAATKTLMRSPIFNPNYLRVCREHEIVKVVRAKKGAIPSKYFIVISSPTETTLEGVNNNLSESEIFRSVR